MKKETRISRNIGQIIGLIIVIFLFRILYVDLYLSLQDTYQYSLYDYVSLFFSDVLSVMAALALNLIFVFQLEKRCPHGVFPVRRMLDMVAYLFLSSFLVTLLVNRVRIFTPDDTVLTASHLILSFLAVLLVNAVFVVLADLGLYYRKSSLALKAEKNQKRKAQYQYHLLKQQLNPHFLFNSLNILDYLVQSGESERASQFIRKMARVYRYLLSESECQLVPLKEELQFTRMYIDLLKERFAEGLFVEIDVPERYDNKQIVPCGLQLLVENATKHNVVDMDHPLHLRIYCEDDSVVVTNNRQPKLNKDESTRFGLASIRKQYADIADKEIEIDEDKEEFTVKLPLI